MDFLESMELSFCISAGILTFASTMHSLCTLCPGDVVELARMVLP